MIKKNMEKTIFLSLFKNNSSVRDCNKKSVK